MRRIIKSIAAPRTRTGLSWAAMCAVSLAHATATFAGDVIVTDRTSRVNLNVFAGYGAVVDQTIYEEETTSTTDGFFHNVGYTAEVLEVDAGAAAEGSIVRSEVLHYDGASLSEVFSNGSQFGEARHLYGVGGSAITSAIHELRVEFDVVDSPVDYRLFGEFLPDVDLSLIELWQTDPVPTRLFLVSTVFGDSGPFDTSGTLEPGSYYLNADVNIFAFASSGNPFETRSTDYELTFLLGDAVTAPRLDISGDCPGPITLTASNMEPSSTVGFVYALAPGSFTIPNGFVCGGTVLDLASPVALGGTTQSDASGVATITVNAPAQACGLVRVQAIDTVNCQPTNVVQVP